MERKLTILKQILGNYSRTGDEHLFSCPQCRHHKRKLSVNIDKNVFKCWICEYSGRTIRRLVRKHGTFKLRQEWDELDGRVDISRFDELFSEEVEEEVEQVVPLPPKFASLANKSLPLAARIPLKYLQDRGVTRSDILRWKIGYCTSGQYSDRVVIPSFGISGRPNYFVARSYKGNWNKYMNPQASRDIIFNELYLDFDEDLVIVEGIFDAIIAGPNAVPILGSNLNERSILFQEIVKNDTPIYIALDPDAEKKALKLIENLLEYGIELHKVSISPYSDVGEMTKEEFQKRKAKSTFLNSENYLLYRTMSI